LAKESLNKKLIHIAYSNLIHSYFLNGEKQNGLNCLKEYENLIDYENLNDLMQINNLKIEIYSQLSDCENLRRQIIEGYSLLRSRAKENKRYSIDVSTLRMMHNAHMNIDAVLDVINKNIKDYYFWDMPEKYIAFKEIINVLELYINRPEYRKYWPLYTDIMQYMRTQALTDIEKYIDSLEKYEVLQRCIMLTEKAIVLIKYGNDYNFDVIYSILNSAKDIYKVNGMYIDMIKVDLNIADECLKTNRFGTMRKHVNSAEDCMKNISGHPAAVEFNLRLAFYNYILKNMEKAKVYFKAFKESRFSIYHFSWWMQEYYDALSDFLKTMAIDGG
jgi:hypothetical protein